MESPKLESNMPWFSLPADVGSIELAFWANVCFEPAKMELVGDGWSIALEDEDGLAWPGFTRIHRDESAEAQQLRLEWLIVYTSIYKCTHTPQMIHLHW